MVALLPGSPVLVEWSLFLRMVRHSIDRCWDVGSVSGAEDSVLTVLLLAGLGQFPAELDGELPSELKGSVARLSGRVACSEEVV